MAMPKEITEIWDFLHGEVAWLHGRWSMYRQLFGISENRINVLNRVAPTYFGTIQKIQLDEVQLTLSRLSDPAWTGKRQNLTLETLVEGLDALGVPDLASALKGHLEEYRRRCEKIIVRRNKQIAHNDFVTHQESKAQGLHNASREEVEQALDALRVFMRAVYEYFEHLYMAYEHFVMHSDANGVLRIAGEALRYRELMESGKIDSADFVTSPYAKL